MGEEDVRNAAERLRKLLRAAAYPQLGALRLEAGDVAELLRVLHFVLLDSSRAVAQFLVERGYDLSGKTDARFVESAFRLLRDEFRCFPSLTPAQFLCPQFVARRLTIVADAAAAVAQKKQELQRRKRREEAVWAAPQPSKREAKPTVENHVLPTAVANHAASILQHLKQQDPRRRVRRASSETPVQVDGGQEKRFTGTRVDARASPVIQTTVQFASEGEGSLSEESFAVDDVVQTESRVQSTSCTCSCSQDSAKLTKALEALSRQLAEVSSALMGKISSVDNRLGRLENQVHEVQEAVEEQREFAWKSNVEGSSKLPGDRATRSGENLLSTAEKHNERQDADPPCAWPPQPSVFERY
jgi:hypothetical protein